MSDVFVLVLTVFCLGGDLFLLNFSKCLSSSCLYFSQKVRLDWITTPQQKVTRLKEKSGFSSSLPPIRQLYRANFPPTQTPPAACVFCWQPIFGKGETG